mmetsp:Transcript_3307/g.2856  ORF Transcript_3307/g.2856 Transcript_3307/m.2856 type:complete len:126 (-) Transcript_3307:354-731(-)
MLTEDYIEGKDKREDKNGDAFLNGWILEKLIESGAEMGGSIAALYKNDIEKFAIKNSLSRIWTIGKLVFDARYQKKKSSGGVDPVEVLVEKEHGKIMFAGKIVEINSDSLNETKTAGVAVISGLH